MNLHNETRGFRNNNPGNIRHGEKWYGLAEKQTDPDFCQFVSVEYGIRAMFKILQTYHEKYGLKTIREIITRWAPPSENDTEAYIKGVTAATPGNHVVKGKLDKDLNGEWIMGWPSESGWCGRLILVFNIIVHENGICPFDDNFLKKCEHFGE